MKSRPGWARCFVHSTATLVAYDVVKRYRPQTSDHRLVLVGKITIVFGTILAIVSLDGQEQPVVDLPFQEYFTGKTRPFAYPGLSYQRVDVGSRGHNLYVPIPYQKSCKVVAEKDWGACYHIVYSTFPEGTQVPTFRVDLPPDGVAELERVNSFFVSQLGQDPAGHRAGEQTIADTVVIAAMHDFAYQIDEAIRMDAATEDIVFVLRKRS